VCCVDASVCSGVPPYPGYPLHAAEQVQEIGSKSVLLRRGMYIHTEYGALIPYRNDALKESSAVRLESKLNSRSVV
jgi:hypothetical protein